MPKRLSRCAIPILLLLVVFSSNLTAQRDGLKLYISCDLEGVVGTMTGDHLGPAGWEYQAARRWQTQELLAVIEAARESGVTEILISDSHGNGENLILDLLPDDVMLVRSWPRPLAMMEGIDSTFDAVILRGYHASTLNPNGVRAHTMSSGRLAGIWLNELPMPEAGISAAIAGHFGVPVIMISGDDAAVAEAQDAIGDIEGAILKWSISFHSAKTVMPAAAYRIIAETTRSAFERLDEFQPFVLPTPVTLDVRFKNYRPSQVLAYLPIVERTDSHSIRYTGSDMIEVAYFLEFLTNYNVGLEP